MKIEIKEGQQLQVMAMSRNGVWDWLTIYADLQEVALQECIKKRHPHRIIDPTASEKPVEATFDYEKMKERNEAFKPIARRYETGKIGFYDALVESHNAAIDEAVSMANNVLHKMSQEQLNYEQAKELMTNWLKSLRK